MPNVSNQPNFDAMQAFVQREVDRATQPCEKTRDGNHTWQFCGHGLVGTMVYECYCGAVEVRK